MKYSHVLKNAIVSTGLLIFLGGQAWSASQKITYQGQLRESGVPVTDTKNMVFRIFTSSTGGTAVWTSATTAVTVVSGLFRTLLEPTGVNWELTPYLEVEVEGTALTPREELTASPFAINSSLLSGKGYTNATSTPSSPSAGDLWLNTGSDVLNVWSGSSWDQLNGGSGSGTGTIVVEDGDSTIEANGSRIDFSGPAFTVTSSPAGEANVSLDPSSVTLQGNTFNGANQLVQLNGAGNLPALDGSALTNVSSSIDIEENNSSVVGSATNIDFNGDQFNLTADGGAEGDVALNPSSVTLQGNDFNGANQLVQLDGSARLTIGASGTPIARHLSATASLDFGILGALTCESLTVTVTGAADGDTVYVGVPNALASVDVGIAVFNAYVSAANTVTVKRCGLAAGITNPSAATVRVDVWKH